MLNTKDRKVILALVLPLLMGGIILVSFGIALTNIMAHHGASLLIDGSLVGVFFLISMLILGGNFFWWRRWTQVKSK